MQQMSVTKFYANSEEMITSIFRDQGGWQPMAVALTPKGLKLIPIADGLDDTDAANRLRRDLIAAKAKAYAAAYITVKEDSPSSDEAEALGGRKLDEVAVTAHSEQSDDRPDKVLFIFISDNDGGVVRAYGIEGTELGERIGFLEAATSPFHLLLASVH
jgi:hypothetical protein